MTNFAKFRIAAVFCKIERRKRAETEVSKLYLFTEVNASIPTNGRVAELAYAYDSKSYSFGIVGSTPTSPTNNHLL